MRNTIIINQLQVKLHAATGRPLGDDKFIKAIEDETGRELKKRKPGPKNNN